MSTPLLDELRRRFRGFNEICGPDDIQQAYVEDDLVVVSLCSYGDLSAHSPMRDAAEHQLLQVTQRALRLPESAELTLVSSDPEEVADDCSAGWIVAFPVALLTRGRANQDPYLGWLLADPGDTDQIGPGERGRPVRSGIARFVYKPRGGYDSHWEGRGSYRYVLYEDGDPIAAIQIVTRPGHPAQIANVWTEPHRRQEGLAQRLLERAEGDFPWIEHSPDLSRSGAAWARKMNSRGIATKPLWRLDATGTTTRGDAYALRYYRPGSKLRGPLKHRRFVLVFQTSAIRVRWLRVFAQIANELQLTPDRVNMREVKRVARRGWRKTTPRDDVGVRLDALAETYRDAFGS